ncbi:MAG: VWA domain-containing protein [Candidatus Lokiarchaeota archaeon]|nr:VWA domain-containing protein [Candidatus Lokiarchaeota archaeon]
MFKNISVNSEEFIFYLDLSKDFIKKKNLMKSITAFEKEKEKFHSVTTYGLIMFQKKENLITIYDQPDTEIISKTINDKWESRENDKSFLENGLFEVLAYIFTKSKENRKNYRVIVFSDTPSGLSEEYHHALYDLLLKAKFFDAFIDIIRVGDEKFFTDDVKLKVMTSETKGGVFYCNDPKIFQDILSSLLQNKNEFSVILPEEDDEFLDEDKLFYEKLAVDLITLDPEDEEICTICNQALCPICEAHSDEIHKCFNCDAKYHLCCATKHSITNNIGFKHIFRCIKCDTLLKIDEEFVDLIIEEENEEPEIDDEALEVDVESEIIISDEIELEDFGEPIAQEETEYSEESAETVVTKKVKIGGFFGQEIEIKSNSNGNGISQSSSTIINMQEEGETMTKEPISITALKPPKKKTIKLCQICGETVRNAGTCPTCGARID